MGSVSCALPLWHRFRDSALDAYTRAPDPHTLGGADLVVAEHRIHEAGPFELLDKREELDRVASDPRDHGAQVF